MRKTVRNLFFVIVIVALITGVFGIQNFPRQRQTVYAADPIRVDFPFITPVSNPVWTTIFSHGYPPSTYYAYTNQLTINITQPGRYQVDLGWIIDSYVCGKHEQKLEKFYLRYRKSGATNWTDLYLTEDYYNDCRQESDPGRHYETGVGGVPDIPAIDINGAGTYEFLADHYATYIETDVPGYGQGPNTHWTESLEPEWVQVTLLQPFQPNIEQSKSYIFTTDTDGDGEADPGDRIKYTLTTTNTGTAPHTGYTIQDDLSDIAKYANVDTSSITPSNGTYNSTTHIISWPSQPIDIGQSIGTSFEVDVRDYDQWEDDIDWLMTNVYGNQKNIPVNPPPDQPNIVHNKSYEFELDQDGDGKADPGDIIKYTLRATNTGDGDHPGYVIEDDISDIVDYTYGPYDISDSGVYHDPINITSHPASVSWGNNKIYVYARGADNNIYQIHYNGGNWGSWVSLGVTATSGPAVASFGEGHLDVFYKGTDNALWHKWWDGTTWNGPQSLGGQITSDPDAISWPASNEIYVYAKGTNDDIYQIAYDGSSWGSWASLGVTATSGPTVASWATNRLDVFFKGTDGSLYQKYWNGSQWSDPFSLGRPAVGINSDPAAASWGSNRIDVFVRGGDNKIWQVYYNGSWSSWVPLDTLLDKSLTLASGPSISSQTENNLDVFTRDADGTLWRLNWNGGRWNGWQSVDHTISWPAQPIPAGGYIEESFKVEVKGSSEWPTDGDLDLYNVYGDEIDIPVNPPVGPNIVRNKSYEFITDQDGDGHADPGDIIRYTLRATNNGNDDHSGYVIEDDLSDIVDYTSDPFNISDSGAYNSSTHMISWPAQPIPAGGYVEETFDVTVSNYSEWPTDGDLDLYNVYGDEITVVVDTPPDEYCNLIIEKTDHRETASPGEELTYEITYRNEGNITAEDVRIEDTLPEEVVFISASPEGYVYDETEHKVIWENLGSLAPGESGTVYITVQIPDDTPNGTVLHDVVVISTATPETDYDDNYDDDYTEVVITPTPTSGFRTIIIVITTLGVSGIVFVLKRKLINLRYRKLKCRILRGK